MNIYITHGVGEGLTNLAAFDAALYNAGIANYNLIKLSSIIPIGSNVIVKRLKRNNIEYGYKLYVVLSSGIVDQPGESIYVGLGWKNSGKYGGILVEHTAKSKKRVSDYIKATLSSVAKFRPVSGRVRQKTIGVKCVDKPKCAVVAAVFKSEGWD